MRRGEGEETGRRREKREVKDGVEWKGREKKKEDEKKILRG